MKFTTISTFTNISMIFSIKITNSEDNNSYSKYPTYDKKYECQTGPFEGFFVSSVEFCKFKFDDNKRDNRIGPAGPQGTPGPAGPAGPAGANQIDSTNLYLVTGEEVSAGTTPTPSIATCRAGDVVVEGGYAIFFTTGKTPPYELFEGPLPHPLTHPNIPFYTGPNNSAYGVMLVNIGVGSVTQFQAYAYCFDNSP